MRIKSIELLNFKGLSDYKAEFSDHNDISGFNGAGKSSIKDAIVFALYGRTAEGSVQNVDTFIKRGEGSARVAVTLDDGVEISRMKSERSTLLYLNDGSQTEEDSKVAQRDLEGNTVPDFDKFISVFNPGYFMNNLDDKIQREFIMGLTPPINRNELFTQAGGDAELCNKFCIRVDNFSEAYTAIKKERFECKKTIDSLTAQKEYVGKQMSQALIFVDDDVLAKDFEEKKKALDDMILARDNWRAYKLKKDAINPAVMHNSKVKIQAKIAREKILDVPAEPSREYMDKLSLEISKLYDLSIPKEYDCPTCHQKISDEHRESIKKFNDANKDKRMVLEAEYAKVRNEFESKSDHREKVIRNNLTFTAQATAFERSEVDIPETSKPIYDDPDNADITDMEYKYNELKNTIEHKNASKSLDKDIKESLELLKEINKLADLFGPTGLPAIEASKKIAPIEEELAKIVEGAKIITLRLMKNGMEYKDTFDIEINGKRYARLSSGEKKKVDVALSIVFNKFIKKQSGSFATDSIFIDDSDLIDGSGIDFILKHVDGQQIFITHVTDNKLILNTNGRSTNA